jgi:hypothetical protein
LKDRTDTNNRKGGRSGGLSAQPGLPAAILDVAARMFVATAV